jgi:hypothetical protein
VAASSAALEAISCADALVCSLEAETSSADAVATSATEAAPVTAPSMRAARVEISRTAAAMPATRAALSSTAVIRGSRSSATPSCRRRPRR